MLDQWVTESLCRHTIARGFFFFRNRFQRNIWAGKSKDECSKTIKPISKFLSHIKSTWIKLRIHSTFTKFSKSWHIPFNTHCNLCGFCSLCTKIVSFSVAVNKFYNIDKIFLSDLLTNPTSEITFTDDLWPYSNEVPYLVKTWEKKL